MKNFGRNQAIINPKISYDQIIDDFFTGLAKKKVTPKCLKHSMIKKKVQKILRAFSCLIRESSVISTEIEATFIVI